MGKGRLSPKSTFSPRLERLIVKAREQARRHERLYTSVEVKHAQDHVKVMREALKRVIDSLIDAISKTRKQAFEISELRGQLAAAETEREFYRASQIRMRDRYCTIVSLTSDKAWLESRAATVVTTDDDSNKENKNNNSNTV